MEHCFIPTENVDRLGDICDELESSDSLIGPSLAVVTGRAGRGKSEAAKRRATQTSAVYLPPFNKRSPLMILRAITFELCKAKPGRIEGCMDIIATEMAKQRRLIMVDEADLLPIDLLEMLRNVNEWCSCPILFIGEDDLVSRISERRRISSRVRRTMAFAPMSQPDIVVFLRRALDVAIEPKVAALIHHYSEGDWRPVLALATDIERAMEAERSRQVSDTLVKSIIHERERKQKNA